MFVCVLSNLRYLEQEVVSPRWLHHLEELCLASCTNCFSSLYNEWFERKSLWKFFASYMPNSRARIVTLLVTLGSMNLAQYLTTAGTFSKVTCWRTRPLHVHHGTTVAITDIRQIMYTCQTTCVSREKGIGNFSAVTSWIAWMQVILPGYPRQDESCPLLEHHWNILEGYTLKDTPSTSRVP